MTTTPTEHATPAHLMPPSKNELSHLHLARPGEDLAEHMANWFYTDALAAQQGPVDGATLLDLNRAGELKAKSLVWREGMAEWTPFREVAQSLLTAEAGVGEGEPPVEIGVCAHSGQVYPLKEMLPYGAALVGPEHKADFVSRLMEGAAVEIEDATLRRLDYVGFWWRTLSSLLDYMVKMIPSGLCMVPYYIVDATDGLQPGSETDSFLNATGMTGLTALVYGLGVLASLVLSIAYDTWMVGRYQATLGKMIIGAKVVNPDGSRLTYRRAFVRWLVKKPLIQLLVWVPPMVGLAVVVGLNVGVGMVGGGGPEGGATVAMAMLMGMLVFVALLALCSGVYWMAAFDPEKRALHDRIAGTRVVKK